MASVSCMKEIVAPESIMAVVGREVPWKKRVMGMVMGSELGSLNLSDAGEKLYSVPK